MRKQFSNQEILLYANQLNNAFLENGKDVELPIKINFYLQKNIKTFMTAAQEIDEARLKIGEKYGEYNPDNGSFIISDFEKRRKANEDMNKLLSIDQILEIYVVSLTELEKDTKLTVAQMNAMLFMIDDDTEAIQYIDIE